MATTVPSRVYSPQRLLVVDDELAVLKMVKLILVRAQYEVVTCESAEAALELLKSTIFDCVITDAVMPNTSGYDLIRIIRTESEQKTIPILMLTRKRHRQDVKKAVDLGVTDYVLKPIDEHLLLDKVELCLRKGTGKRYILECALHGEQAKGEVTFSCQILSISESYMACLLPLPIALDQQCEMAAPVFSEIGIPPPMIKVIACNPVRYGDRDTSYEVKFSFIGVPEVELRKIRNWLNRLEIQRRK